MFRNIGDPWLSWFPFVLGVGGLVLMGYQVGHLWRDLKKEPTSLESSRLSFLGGWFGGSTLIAVAGVMEFPPESFWVVALGGILLLLACLPIWMIVTRVRGPWQSKDREADAGSAAPVWLGVGMGVLLGSTLGRGADPWGPVVACGVSLCFMLAGCVSAWQGRTNASPASERPMTQVPGQPPIDG